MSQTITEDVSRDDALRGGEMPRGDGDVRHIETRGLAPIPIDRRYGTLPRIFTLWFAPNLIMSALFTGVVVGSSGLGFWWGLLALVIGLGIGNAPAAYLAGWGPKTGVAQIPLARLSFGKGVIAPGVLTWLTTVLYDALNTVFGGEAVHLLIHVPFWVGIVLIIVPQLLLGVVGYEAIHQYERWMSFVLGAMFLVLTIRVIDVGTWGGGSTLHGGHMVGTFFAMVALALAYNFTWLVYASDYTRYLPPETSARKVSWTAFAGLFLGSFWVMLLGLAATSIGSNQTSAGVRALMGGGVLGGGALLAIYLGSIAVNSMDDYTGSLALQAVNIKVHRHIVAAFVGVLCLLTALWLHAGGTFANKAEDVILLTAYWMAPFLAIVVIDWVQKRGRLAIDRVTEWHLLTNDWRPLTALIIGFAAMVPFMDTSLYTGPVPKHLDGTDLSWIVGVVAGAVAYLCLQRIRVRTPQDELGNEVVERAAVSPVAAGDKR
jgi:nucleobase:cation symporter-1, NCS1 family